MLGDSLDRTSSRLFQIREVSQGKKIVVSLLGGVMYVECHLMFQSRFDMKFFRCRL